MCWCIYVWQIIHIFCFVNLQVKLADGFVLVKQIAGSFHMASILFVMAMVFFLAYAHLYSAINLYSYL